MTRFLIFVLLFISQLTTAQKKGEPYKIDESQWSEKTYGFKMRNTFKKNAFRYGIDTYKEVLTGTMVSKRTIYSDKTCSCILVIIYLDKGVPYELVDHLFKFRKYYERDAGKWNFVRQERRVGYVRCL
ncbi:MAG: hypothetical protein JKY18_13390 [Flavobacteriales bacterium]|nr:hypothetical protein [Flavobacteriales bacterium]